MATTIASTDVGGTGLATVGTNGQVLTSNGTTLSWQTPSAGTSFSAGTTGFTPNTATTGTVTLAGTLGTANGGTNLTSFTSGGALYATSTSALTTGTLPIASGGTGLTSFTAGQIHYGSFSTSANLTYSTSGGLTVNGVTQGYNTTLYTVDGALSNYSSTNAVYLNGNRAGWLGLQADGTQNTYIQLFGSTWSTPNYIGFYTGAAQRMTINATGSVAFGSSAANYGTAGQNLTSTGNGPPVWGPVPYTASYLVVAGGGGGGGTNGGGMGGGGAGGVLQGTVTLIHGTVYTATIGGGGSYGNNPTSGGNSSLTYPSVTVAISYGGGAGSSNTQGPSTGGSGGGGEEGSYTVPAAGTMGQGNSGGVGGANSGTGGGGGGAGGNGTNGAGGCAGNGGIGIVSNITGTYLMYGAGGGGFGNNARGGWPNGGAGSGGPGNFGATTNGTANTGMGGAGSYSTTPGNGGSGIVIISVPTTYYTGTYTGSPTVTTSGSNTILQFTGTGTYTA